MCFTDAGERSDARLKFDGWRLRFHLNQDEKDSKTYGHLVKEDIQETSEVKLSTQVSTGRQIVYHTIICSCTARVHLFFLYFCWGRVILESLMTDCELELHLVTVESAADHITKPLISSFTSSLF